MTISRLCAAICDIPIVFTEVTDPVGAGLLRTLDKHGSNVTGVSHVAPLPVQLNAIRAYRPFARLRYLHNPAESSSTLVREPLQGLAKAQNFELVNADIPNAADGQPNSKTLPSLIRDISERMADFLYIGASTFLAFNHRDLVTQAALDADLPTFCATESIVRQARCMFGLFSNGANIGRFAASKALQILVQHKPVAQVPASTLQRFSLLVNMNIARQLSLSAAGAAQRRRGDRRTGVRGRYSSPAPRRFTRQVSVENIQGRSAGMRPVQSGQPRISTRRNSIGPAP